MEVLELLNEDTVSREKTKPPVIRLSYGKILFSIEAVKLLGLKSGDKISFVIDKRDYGVIYFKKDSKGFRLTLDLAGQTGDRLRLCCRPVYKKILEHFGINSARTYHVSSEQADVYGEKMWFILKSNKK